MKISFSFLFFLLILLKGYSQTLNENLNYEKVNILIAENGEVDNSKIPEDNIFVKPREEHYYKKEVSDESDKYAIQGLWDMNTHHKISKTFLELIAPHCLNGSGQTYPDPSELAAAHVEAVGGHEAIEALQGYYAKGTTEIIGLNLQAVVEEWIRPGEGWRKRWEDDSFGRVELGYTGGIAWMDRPDRPADAVRDEKYREVAASHTLLYPETDFIRHFGAAHTIGRREIEGRMAWEVHIKGPAGSVQSRFYDEKTGLLRAVERNEMLAGQQIRLLTVYEDWSPIRKVLFPHRMTRTAANGFRDVTKLEYVTTEPVPPETVKPPAKVLAAASEIRYEIEIERNVMVPMRDGVRLATDIYRPRDVKSRLPIILIRTPYHKTRDIGATIPARVFAERGYVVVVQDVRGKWASEGEFHFLSGKLDRKDGYDTIEWTTSQPWSNGRVGTYGCSRLGAVQFYLAPNDTLPMSQ